VHTLARSPLYVPIFILTQVSLARSMALLSTDSTSVISLIGTSVIFCPNILRRPLQAWNTCKKVHNFIHDVCVINDRYFTQYLSNMSFFICFHIYVVFEMIKSNSWSDLQFWPLIYVLLHEANSCFSLTANLSIKSKDETNSISLASSRNKYNNRALYH